MKPKTAKQLAALRKFKPGQSGNPKGRPPGLRAVLKNAGYKKEHVTLIASRCHYATHDELVKVISDPKASMLERTLAKLSYEAFRTLDPKLLELSLSLIGWRREAPPENVTQSAIIEDGQIVETVDPIEASKQYQRLMG